MGGSRAGTCAFLDRVAAFAGAGRMGPASRGGRDSAPWSGLGTCGENWEGLQTRDAARAGGAAAGEQRVDGSAGAGRARNVTPAHAGTLRVTRRVKGHLPGAFTFLAPVSGFKVSSAERSEEKRKQRQDGQRQQS